jgi:hypothetical protein
MVYGVVAIAFLPLIILPYIFRAARGIWFWVVAGFRAGG